MLIDSARLSSLAGTFSGWCWVGADLVVGESGAKEFASARRAPNAPADNAPADNAPADIGPAIKPGLDGCYVTCSQQDGSWIVGTDYSGMSTLFIYRHKNRWIVSDSLFDLATYVREHHLPLTVNKAQLALFLLTDPGTAQQTTFRSIFREISLLPSTHNLEISGGELKRHPVPLPTPASYRQGLNDFINLRRNRLATCLHTPDMAVDMDLSGGLDSRLVTAFLINSEHPAPAASVRVVSSPAHENDYQIATSIAQAFGLNISPNSSNPKGDRLSPAESVTAWKRGSLGTYLPVYLPTTTVHPRYIRGHGADGENRRRSINTAKFVALRALKLTRIAGLKTAASWLADFATTALRLKRTSPTSSIACTYYQQFRNRFHFGTFPRHGMRFMPFESQSLYSLWAATQPSFEQFYVDVLENLAPGLAKFPFNSKDKALPESTFASVTSLQLRKVQPGTVYGSSAEPSTTAPGRAIDTLIDEFSQHPQPPTSSVSLPDALAIPPLTSDVLNGMRKNGLRATSPEALTISRSFLLSLCGLYDD